VVPLQRMMVIVPIRTAVNEERADTAGSLRWVGGRECQRSELLLAHMRAACNEIDPSRNASRQRQLRALRHSQPISLTF
jgi:hypothetical protein